MKTCKISVILTSYNHEKYIKEAIDSVLHQTFKEFEFIIIDDMSQDNSWKIIESYDDERIFAFKTEKQNSIVETLNKAIKEIAKGEYIAIHHSDDVWEPTKLEKQVEFLNENTDYGAVFTNAQAINENSELFKDQNHFYYSIFDQPNRTRYEWLNHFFFHSNALCHPSVLIRKECYDNCGLYRYGLAQLPDLDMWIRLCMKYEIYVLPEKLTKFRVRDNEANSSGNTPLNNIRNINERFFIIKNYLKLADWNELVNVFPEVKKYDTFKGFIPEYVLAMVFLKSISNKAINFLGLRILFDLVNDPVTYGKIKDIYSFYQKDFIKLSAEYDIFNLYGTNKKYAEMVENKNLLLKERDSVIENKNLLLKEREKKIAKQLNEINQLKSVVQSMRLKNRLKRLFFLNRSNLLTKTLKSIKNDGYKSTMVKIKNKLSNTYLSYGQTKKEKLSTKYTYLFSMDEVKDIVNSNFLEIPNNQPLVSIIVLTKDGLTHIKRLFKAIYENTIYNNYEIIVVDNNSNDKTVEFLELNKYNYRLKIIKNSKNESYSLANNQAAEIASGEYLLLMNNDIEPLKGWLSHLVNVIQTEANVGSIGAQLIYPHSSKEPLSCKVQHTGIAFKSESLDILNINFFRPYNLGNGKQPIVKNTKLTVEQRVACSAAVLLVAKKVYFEVGGLDEKYTYGYEDVDFGLKLQKKGYINYYCQNSILFHYESSTQNKESKYELKERRLHNIETLHRKWHDYIKVEYFKEKLKGTVSLFAENKLKIAFAVTEAGEDAVAGDYFTALELAEAFGKMDFDYAFLKRKGDDWYNIPDDVDIVISMLDAFDLTQIKNKSKNIVTIAWIRNWPDKWLENKSILDYDLLFGSSQTLCEMIASKTAKSVILFPIATTPEKFERQKNKDNLFKSDYAFTGNYWGKPREIETYLNPNELQFKLNVYGKDWHMVSKFAPYHKGFIGYKKIPKVYANTKIVIDDAVVGITKPYGSVNSRVFDAIAGGAVVITNGLKGAEETFGNMLPTYETKEELHCQITNYLSDEKLRQAKVEELQSFVFQHHTYNVRALLMKQKIEEYLGLNKSIVIKMPIPNWEEASKWGDYHLALGLKKQFKLKGFHVLLQVIPEWYNNESNKCDIVIVLRGLTEYKVRPHQINFMWNISHPDKIREDEYETYNKVFISSLIWVDYLKQKLTVPVELMHQCTDPDMFKPLNSDLIDTYKTELLFVGNSRNIFRKSLKYLLPTQYDLNVYGTLWEQFIDRKYIKGEHIPNNEVYKYYSATKILLNDHWDSMRDSGFISNRIYDALACNTFVLTDNVKGLKELFGDAIVTYDNEHDLKEKIEYFLYHGEERVNLVKNARKIVLNQHTYKNRVEQFLNSSMREEK